MTEVNQPQKVIVVNTHRKSMTITILLTLFFGPLGLFYSSVSGGIIMLILSVIVGFFTLGVGLLFIVPVCIIWGVIATSNYNAKASVAIRN